MLALIMFVAILVKRSFLTSSIGGLYKTGVGRAALLYILLILASAITNMRGDIVKYIVNAPLLYLACLISGIQLARMEALTKVAKMFLCLAIIVGVLGLIEEALGHNFLGDLIPVPNIDELQDFLENSVTDKVRGQYRAQSTFVHPLIFAQFLVLMLPLTYVAAYRGRRKIANLAITGGITSLLIGATLASGSRAALIVICFYGLIWALGILRPTPIAAPQRASRLFSVGMTALSLVLAISVMPIFIYQNVTGSSVEEEQSSMARLVQLHNSIEVAQEKPLLGWGPKTAADLAGTPRAWTNSNSIDSSYLSILVENGVPALLIWMYIQINVLIELMKSWRHKNLLENQNIYEAITLGLAGFFIMASIVSSNALYPLVFLFLGIQAHYFKEIKRAKITKTILTDKSFVMDAAGVANA